MADNSGDEAFLNLLNDYLKDFEACVEKAPTDGGEALQKKIMNFLKVCEIGFRRAVDSFQHKLQQQFCYSSYKLFHTKRREYERKVKSFSDKVAHSKDHVWSEKKSEDYGTFVDEVIRLIVDLLEMGQNYAPFGKVYQFILTNGSIT